MRAMVKVVAFGLFCGFAGSAFAQDPPEDGPRPGGRPRDEAFKMVDAYVLSNIQESLSLTDDQFVKLLPLVKRLQTDRRSFAEKRHQALRDLRRQLKTGTATEAQVGQALRDIKKFESEEPAALRRNMDAIDAALDPLQQAKFRVLQVEVELKIREIMNQMRPEGRLRGRREGASQPPRPQP